MKKLIYLFCLGITPSIIYAQSVTILPSNNNEIVVKGNVGGTTGTIDGQFTTRSSDRDAVLRTSTNHPISFAIGSQTRMRLNTGGDLGIGNEIAYSTWDGDINSSNNRILSRMHSYGIGSKTFSGPNYAPFKTAILGQAVAGTSAHNRAGILGVTDGKASAGYYNIGVASFSTSDPAATGNTYNFWGYNRNNSNTDSYGIRNEVSSGGTADNYGVFSQIYTTGTSNLFGSYNLVTTNNNSITTNESFGTYNDISGNRRLTAVYNKITKNGPGTPSIYGTNTEVEIVETANYAYGEKISVTNPSGSFAFSYGLRSDVANHSTWASYGVYAGTSGTGTGTKYGLYASATGSGTLWAGYFAGNVHINGTLSKSSGTFKIDHPQDPENKYLIHSFVESPDMMNVYNGNISTDADGNATVELPKYFESLNKDFRYQLTAIGQKADAWIAQEISGNTFKISTDKPNVKISWQVTGVRQDAYANANRIIPEVDKQGDEKGKYLNPEAFGKSIEAGINNNYEKNRQEDGNTKTHKEVITQETTPRTVTLPKESTGQDNTSNK